MTTVNLDDAKNRIGDRVALQGNMDPSVLYASQGRVRQEVARILKQFGRGRGHVFNLGHGIHPGIDPDNVHVLVEAVHEMSIPFHD